MKKIELILDESKWICGSDTDNMACKRGKGATRLLNDQGYMCCLGQFMLQLDKTLTEEDIRGKAYPSSVDKRVEVFRNNSTGDSDLTQKAVAINDDTELPVEEKVTRLQKLFNEYNMEIIFKPMKPV